MKKILPIFLTLLMGTHAFANDFFAYIGGGLSTLMYDMKGSDKSNGFGGLFGFGYNYFFTPNWGVGSGLEIAFYNAEFKFKEYKQPPYTLVDFEGNEMEFRSTLNGYKEEQSVMLLQIPLMLQYQRDYSCDKFPKLYALYAAAGTKIGIPLTGDNKITADSVKNSGYRRFEDYEYKTQKFMGFGTFADQKDEKELPLQTAVLLSAEAGAKWKLNETYRLYTGAYIDYGLNSVTKRRHHPGRAIEYNSQERTFAIENLVDEAAPLAIGLKVKLSFGAGSAVAETEKIAKEAENKQRELLEANAIAAEKEAARLASIQEGKAAHLQARIDSIQNQVLNDFHITQTKPSEKQIPALDAIIALLKDHPELRFYINGHTCDQGDKEINRIVGYERAKAVKDYVISKGIDENRILGIGSKLYYEPLVPNTSEENRRKNRRVEFVIEKWLPPDGN
ncbi:MAG: OmpA family protein [Fibromonadaceae bacterium]|jgi:outer membrane protein OmpA-like peptidoglycan-associated protein|nr:OmpA family protein [Fibromonadaceae bacterium]